MLNLAMSAPSLRGTKERPAEAGRSVSGCNEVLESRTDLRAPQRGQRVPLDLPGALAREAHDRADLLEGPRGAGVQAEAQDQHLALTVGQRAEHLLQRLAPDGLDSQLVRPDGGGVLQEVLEGGAVVADRSVQRGDRLCGVEQPVDLVQRHVQLDGQLLDGRLPTEHLVQAGLGAAQAPDLLVHVDRQADGPGTAVGGPTGDRLADPPGRIGRELEALAPVELLDRAQQPQVALLDQVAEGKPGRREAPRDRQDRKSTRLNSSHEWISYAVFCLKKKTSSPPSPSFRTRLTSESTCCY